MTVKMPNQLFINGEFVEAQTGKTFDTINPADETVSTIGALTALKMKFSIKDFFSARISAGNCRFGQIY